MPWAFESILIRTHFCFELNIQHVNANLKETAAHTDNSTIEAEILFVSCLSHCVYHESKTNPSSSKNVLLSQELSSRLQLCPEMYYTQS